MPPIFSSPVVAILHCGASCTAPGVFQLSGRRLRCVHYAAESFPAGALGEDNWREHTARALQSLNLSQQFIGPAVLVLPAHLTLTKQIKVPRVEPAKRNQVIHFEAEQAIPHALTEVAWDFVISGLRETEEDILLLAARKETIDQLCLAAQTAGFEPERILPTALATLGVYRLARSEFAPPALVLNLGERSAILLQLERDRLATRTVALALPLEDGGNPGREADGALQSFATKLAQEISRSIRHFGRENGLADPAQVFLTGGGPRQSELGAALAARLEIPVMPLDGRSAVEFSSNLAAGETVPPGLTELMGAAAIVLLPSQPTADLLPSASQRRASLRRRQPWLIAAMLLTAVVLLPPIVHFRQVAATARAKIAAMEKTLVPLRAREAHMRSNLAQLALIKASVAQLQSVHDRRTSWLQLFADVQEKMVKVEDVWLEKFQPIPAAEGGAMRLALSGRMLDRSTSAAMSAVETNRRVKALLAGFAGLPQVAAIESERFDDSQAGLLRFELILRTNPARPL